MRAAQTARVAAAGNIRQVGGSFCSNGLQAIQRTMHHARLDPEGCCRKAGWAPFAQVEKDKHQAIRLPAIRGTRRASGPCAGWGLRSCHTRTSDRCGVGGAATGNARAHRYASPSRTRDRESAGGRNWAGRQQPHHLPAQHAPITSSTPDAALLTCCPLIPPFSDLHSPVEQQYPPCRFGDEGRISVRHHHQVTSLAGCVDAIRHFDPLG